MSAGCPIRELCLGYTVNACPLCPMLRDDDVGRRLRRTAELCASAVRLEDAVRYAFLFLDSEVEVEAFDGTKARRYRSRIAMTKLHTGLFVVGPLVDAETIELVSLFDMRDCAVSHGSMCCRSGSRYVCAHIPKQLADLFISLATFFAPAFIWLNPADPREAIVVEFMDRLRGERLKVHAKIDPERAADIIVALSYTSLVFSCILDSDPEYTKLFAELADKLKL